MSTTSQYNRSAMWNRSSGDSGSRRHVRAIHTYMSQYIRSILLLLALPGLAQAQTYTITPTPFQTILDNSGNTVNAGCIWTYTAGTTTPVTTYSDNAGTPNANPIIASSSGRFTAYLVPGQSYKYVYENIPCSASSHGTVLRTADNIPAMPASSGNAEVPGTAGEAITAGQVVYLSAGDGSKNAGQWYKADSANTYSSTTNVIGMAPNAILSGASGTIRLAGQITGLSSLTVGAKYYVGTGGALTATAPSNSRKVGEADAVTSLIVTGNHPVDNQISPLGIAEGRLTATTALPITTADVSAATSIFWTPYRGNRIALYDGASAWGVLAFTELTISVTTCTASKPYDVFLYNNSGVVASEILVWTNSTTRATALTTQDGVYVKTGATTRRYVGSFYCNASGGQTDDTAAKRYVWNYYNRVPRSLVRTESTATWTYTLAAWQQANAAAANQLDVMIGVAEVLLQAEITTTSMNSNANIGRYIAFGEDSTSTPMSAGIRANIDNATMVIPIGEPFRHHAILRHYPAVGRHFYTWLESSTATAVTTWTGSPVGATQNQMGMIGTIEG